MIISVTWAIALNIVDLLRPVSLAAWLKVKNIVFFNVFLIVLFAVLYRSQKNINQYLRILIYFQYSTSGQI